MRLLINEIRRSRLELTLVVLGTALVLGTVIVLHWVEDAPFENLVKDSASLTGAPFHQGFLSNAGILLWAAAAAVASFAALLLFVEDRRDRWLRFVLATAALSAVAALDDTFMLHEQALPHAGIPERLTMSAYLLAGAAYLMVFRSQLLQTRLALLGLTVALIAFSTALDLTYPNSTGGGLLLEEAAKFAGILSWLAFVTTASLTALTSRPGVVTTLDAPIEPADAYLTRSLRYEG